MRLRAAPAEGNELPKQRPGNKRCSERERAKQPKFLAIGHKLNLNPAL
jgi:hypothetical protein